MLQFDLLKTDPSSHARRGALTLNHGVVQTPIFMPVGTYGTVKGVMPRSLHEMGAQIILGNTFHLWMRPGLDIMKGFGGLHQFEKWDKPILTDSGGFQVWSLGDMRKITEEGVHFASPVNGDKLFMSPEVSMQIQTILNSDIVMQLDECTPYETKGHLTAEAEARKAAEDEGRCQMALATRSLRRSSWAQRPVRWRETGSRREAALADGAAGRGLQQPRRCGLRSVLRRWHDVARGAALRTQGHRRRPTRGARSARCRRCQRSGANPDVGGAMNQTVPAGTFIVSWPARICSVANMREHWSKRAARAKRERTDARLRCHQQLDRDRVLHELNDVGLTVTMVRIAPRPLDSDNLAAAFKSTP